MMPDNKQKTIVLEDGSRWVPESEYNRLRSRLAGLEPVKIGWDGEQDVKCPKCDTTAGILISIGQIGFDIYVSCECPRGHEWELIDRSDPV